MTKISSSLADIIVKQLFSLHSSDVLRLIVVSREYRKNTMSLNVSSSIVETLIV